VKTSRIALPSAVIWDVVSEVPLMPVVEQPSYKLSIRHGLR
jgi:hypothetical protein